MRIQRLCITQPRRAELQQHDEPEVDLPADSIEGLTLASAVSPGSEIGWAFGGNDPSRLPCYPGYALTMRVTQVGSAAAGEFAVGDLVYCSANHRSHVRCRANEAWRIPGGLSPADATIARLAAVSWSTLTTTSARPPDRVVVTGLGIVGNLAAQNFAAAGYRVLACDPVAGRRALLDGLGIETRERLPLDDQTWASQTSLVIDCSGHEAAVLDACKLVRKGGEVVLVGVPWAKRTELSAFDVLHAVFHRYVNLRSGWEWQVPGEPSEFRSGSIRANLEAALHALATGRLRTTGLYRTADPRAPEPAYLELMGQGGGPLTAVFDWTQVEADAGVSAGAHT